MMHAQASGGGVVGPGRVSGERKGQEADHREKEELRLTSASVVYTKRTQRVRARMSCTRRGAHHPAVRTPDNEAMLFRLALP